MLSATKSFFQMALSWIFSGKKKEEKSVPVTVEAVEVGSDGDYSIIQANTSHMGIYPQVPPSTHAYTPLPFPYPILPPRQDKLSVGNSIVRTNSVQNQLEGVPFVLSPMLGQRSSSDLLTGLEDLKRVVYQITADVNDSTFQYNFKLERSVLQEASVYSPDN